MNKRRDYMVELREAIAEILDGRDTITLGEIEEQLPPTFSGRIPGRVTLAKAVTGLGWARRIERGVSATYFLPKGGK